MAGHRFNPEHAGKLLSETRRESIPMNKVIELMKLGADDVVADLGAGNGFFTLPIAKRTGNKVHAVDIEPKMMEMLKGNAEKEQVKNIDYIVSSLDNIKLPDGTADKVLTAFVTHEVDNLEQVLNEVRRILKSGGKWLLLDWEAVESESGPPLHERIPSERLAELMKKNGYNVHVSHLNPSTYVIEAELNEGGEVSDV